MILIFPEAFYVYSTSLTFHCNVRLMSNYYHYLAGCSLLWKLFVNLPVLCSWNENVTNVVRIFAPPRRTSWLTSDCEDPPPTFQQRVAPMTAACNNSSRMTLLQLTLKWGRVFLDRGQTLNFWVNSFEGTSISATGYILLHWFINISYIQEEPVRMGDLSTKWNGPLY